MIVRALDSDHDWTFGKGRNNYFKNQDALIQNINTRLNSFLGDCFFDLAAGVDWFNLLGGKSVPAIELAVSTIILNTEGVTQILQVNIDLDSVTRALNISYSINSVYTLIQGETVIIV